MKGYTMEKIMRIYNDEDGTCVEIHEDSDGLGLVEILDRDEKEKIINRLSYIDTTQARLVAEAIIKECDFLESKEVGK